jgi:hypothetical protein
MSGERWGWEGSDAGWGVDGVWTGTWDGSEGGIATCGIPNQALGGLHGVRRVGCIKAGCVKWDACGALPS